MATPFRVPPAPALFGTSEKKSNRVIAKVLISEPEAVIIDIAEDDLNYLKVSYGGSFQITINGITRPVHMSSDERLNRDRHTDPVAKVNADGQRQLDALTRELKQTEDSIATAPIEERIKIFRKIEGIKSAMDIIRVPEDLRPTMPLYANQSNSFLDSNYTVC